MPDDGVLLHSTPHATWAWVGLRLAPAQGLAAHRGYLDVPEKQRRTEAVHAELDWLQRQFRPGEHTRLDLRYLADPGSQLLRCVLLGQVAAPTPAAARAAGSALRERLGALPAHLAARPITDPAELLAALRPVPAAGQAVELRPPLTAVPLLRPDSDRSHAVLAGALRPGAESWEPVWSALAALTAPTVLSVALEPVRLEPVELGELARYAAEYRRLASPGQTAAPWGRVFPGDPAAGPAAAALEGALAGFAGPLFRLRATLLGGDGGVLAPAGLLAGIAGAAVLPVVPGEAGIVAANLAGLNLDPLPVTHQQGLAPGHYGWVEQTVSSLATPAQAGALLRLPYQVPGHRLLFDDRFPAGGVTDAVPGAARPAGPEPHLPAF
ncbi:hypothetical protein ACFYNO_03485 [Kitasatospora sp. NPDC006697]|uniref:hypothetical protein n=1 Tax=Kitasatospora sp. NPDC006697 TaxID=3364020 RepID=UPI0036C8CD78